MARRRRIAVQIVAAGLGALAAMAGLWFAAGAYLLAEYDHAASVLTLADQIDRDVQQARRWEKNFLLNDVRSPAFHQNVSRGSGHATRSLSEHSNATESLGGHIAAIGELLDNPTLTSELGSRADEYAAGFSTIVDAYLERGYQDWGLIGHWREAAHQIESAAEQNGDAELQIALLALRRSEKDFLLRGSEYEAAVYDQIGSLRQILESSDAQPTLRDALDRYADAFRSYVETNERIGLTENDGLRADMRGAAQAIEAAAGTLATNAEVSETRVRRNLILTSIVIGLVGVGIAAALILWRARIITRPLVNLQESARRFGRGELETRVRVDERNENGRTSLTHSTRWPRSSSRKTQR